jgi:hypothetical protein
VTDPVERIEAPTELDEAEIQAMYNEPDGVSGADEPQFHTVLEVWREVLRPVSKEKHARITPAWANRITSSYRELDFADMRAFQEIYYDLHLELLGIVHAEIATDSDCLSYTTPEEDAAENAGHYRQVLIDWQTSILRRELAWECDSETAAVELAAISEIHKFYFGAPNQQGLTAYLENIKLEYTEADQLELRRALDEVRVEFGEARELPEEG